MDLQRLQQEVHEWHKANFGTPPAEYPLLIAVEELGELAHAHMKGVQKIRTDQDHQRKSADAIGDIVIALAAYCSLRGFSFEQCVRSAWSEVQKRDWKRDPINGTGGQQ